ncbi:hypothetical protein LAZ67_20001327 [Cordylochernes scorpioides]|uniref:Helix-turn-helix domain-containing protein n=1 Tax=Cordylochernes scorpioides TaxID=51811 RepID=A0ABY6LMD4_9ARAC|nr:hypothetical protein LAZ67_20001327 [Cordylochernes scorpioides]
MSPTKFCHILTFFFIKNDESYHTTVYYKKSIKPSYLLFDSYNPIGHKLTVVRTLTKRIHTHCSTPAFKKIEKTTIISNLTSRGYPLPFILRHSFNPSKHTQPAVNRNTCIIPYSFENQSIAHSLKKFGLRTFFTNHLSIGQILRNPITRSNIKKRPDQQPYAIYSIGCQDCNAKYVVAHKQRCVNKGVIVVQKPIFVLPQIRAFLAVCFAQIVHNLQVIFLIDRSTLWQELMIHHAPAIAENCQQNFRIRPN